MSATVACRGCGRQNAPSQRFCGACGAALGLDCSACGAENPGDFRFCGSCGAALTEPAQVDRAPSGERRWATVLFADLSGWTATAEDLDPEDARNVVDGCLRRIGTVVEDFGGAVLSLAGDGLMAAFGAPVAHEDDPERAVRAALEMQACTAEYADEFAGLPLRVGVNTGEVMFAPLGPDSRREPTLTGDVTNTASRLESVAPANGVLVGEATYLATRRAIRYREVDPLRLKGKAAPVRAWVALEAAGDPAARPLSETPLVGRDAELESLRTTWGRVVRDRQPHLVTVLGPPGIGKTKLVREFVRGLGDGDGRALWGRSLPYGERAGYGALGQLVKAAAGIYETDETAVALAKLGSRIRELLPEEEAAETTRHLGALVGLETGGGDLEKRTLFAAVRDFMEGLGTEAPTALVFEDVQWADRSLLELVEWLASHVAEVPILLCAISRLELLDARPDWGGGLPAYAALPLGPLPPTEVGLLADRLLAHRDVEGQIVERVQRIAAGNPLFVEELAAWLSDASRDETRPLPTTVTALISARLDALPTLLRRTLLDASVVGETFWVGALDRAGEEPEGVADALDALETRGFVRRERTSRIHGDAEYSFKHVLIREVAYGLLPRAVRRDRHRQVARYLETKGRSGGVSAAILARHWEEGGEPEGAVASYERAVDAARRTFAADEVVRLAGRALGLLDKLPDGADRDERELSLLLAYGAARFNLQGHVPQTRETYERARAVCRRLGRAVDPAILRVTGNLAIALRDFDEAYALGTELLGTGRRDDDPIVTVEGHYLTGAAAFWRGELDVARREFERALAGYRPELAREHIAVFAQDPNAICLVRLAFALWHIGDLDRALELREEALAYAAELGHPYTLGYVFMVAAWISLETGEADHLERMVGRIDELELPNLWVQSLRDTFDGWLRIRRDPVAAADALRRSADDARTEKQGFVEPLALLLLARTHLLRGDPRGALRVLEEARPLCLHEMPFHAPDFHHVRGEVLAASSSPPKEVEDAFATAARIAADRGAATLELRARAALLRWARMEAPERAPAARRDLREVYERFPEGPVSRDLAEAQHLLEDVPPGTP